MANIEFYNEDCIELMKRYPDNYFELAIVDPPYGIGNWCPSNVSKKGVKASKPVTWNESIPSYKYFDEVLRVSQNQIIWGANYYNCFHELGGALIWHKGNINPVFSQCEIASLSFQKRVDYVNINWQAGFARKKEGVTIHPCQKPVALYKWLLKNYAKQGDKILDTHGGSMSSAIACYDMGFNLVITELDKEYFDKAKKRFDDHVSQLSLFTPKQLSL
jgi:site-specific DNA-methyltransferase (adenine-specific)